jgi:hypothetical protein
MTDGVEYIAFIAASMLSPVTGKIVCPMRAAALRYSGSAAAAVKAARNAATTGTEVPGGRNIG